MNTLRLRATSLHVPTGHPIGDFWRAHHRSLLHTHFKRANLTGTLKWIEGAALIEAELPTSSTTESDLLALANAALISAQYAAFQIAEGAITTAITGWPAGGAAGLVTGSQIAKNQSPLIQLAAMVVVGALGAAISSRVRAEIPIYRLVFQTTGRLAWQRVPFGAAVPSNFAVA